MPSQPACRAEPLLEATLWALQGDVVSSHKGVAGCESQHCVSECGLWPHKYIYVEPVRQLFDLAAPRSEQSLADGSTAARLAKKCSDMLPLSQQSRALTARRLSRLLRQTGLAGRPRCRGGEAGWQGGAAASTASLVAEQAWRLPVAERK